MGSGPEKQIMVTLGLRTKQPNETKFKRTKRLPDIEEVLFQDFTLNKNEKESFEYNLTSYDQSLKLTVTMAPHSEATVSFFLFFHYKTIRTNARRILRVGEGGGAGRIKIFEKKRREIFWIFFSEKMI